MLAERTSSQYESATLATVTNDVTDHLLPQTVNSPKLPSRQAASRGTLRIVVAQSVRGIS
jgi:hypothetical protein